MAGTVGRSVAFTWGGSSILGVREKAIAIKGDPIDITSDEDGGWRTLLDVAAQNEVTVSLSGVTKNGALKADWFAGNRTKSVVITYPNGDTLSGVFFLSSFTDTGPYNDAVTFQAELMSTGIVTFTPGA